MRMLEFLAYATILLGIPALALYLMHPLMIPILIATVLIMGIVDWSQRRKRRANARQQGITPSAS